MKRAAILLTALLVGGTAHAQSRGGYIFPAGNLTKEVPSVVTWNLDACATCEPNAAERNAIEAMRAALHSGRTNGLTPTEVAIVRFPTKPGLSRVSFQPSTLAGLSAALRGCGIDDQRGLGPSSDFPNDRFYGVVFVCRGKPRFLSLAYRDSKLVRAYLVMGELPFAQPALPPAKR